MKKVHAVRKESNIFRAFSAIVRKGSSIVRPESKFSNVNVVWGLL